MEYALSASEVRIFHAKPEYVENSPCPYRGAGAGQKLTRCVKVYSRKNRLPAMVSDLFLSYYGFGIRSCLKSRLQCEIPVCGSLRRRIVRSALAGLPLIGDTPAFSSMDRCRDYPADGIGDAIFKIIL